MEIRSTTDEDLDVFVDTVHAAFGHFRETPVEGGGLWWSALETDRCLLALTEDGRPVGTAAAHSFELTLPGETLVPASGVTAVGVLPSHRRQGVLSAMMRHQLAELRARGEFLSVLLASEAPIYGRFGYGPATYTARLTVPRRVAALAVPRARGVTDAPADRLGQRLGRGAATCRVRRDSGRGLRQVSPRTARRAVPAAPLVGLARGAAPISCGAALCRRSPGRRRRPGRVRQLLDRVRHPDGRRDHRHRRLRLHGPGPVRTRTRPGLSDRVPARPARAPAALAACGLPRRAR